MLWSRYMAFFLDWRAVLVGLVWVAIVWLLRIWSKRYGKAHIGYSSLQEAVSTGWRARLGPLPRWLLWSSLGAFALAFLDPHFTVPKEGSSGAPVNPVEGIAIYMILDHSGSMSDQVPATLPEGMTKLPKIDLLKRLTSAFIRGDRQADLRGRPNDLIGIVAFARGAQVLAPLTLDHAALLKVLKDIRVTDNDEQDGTAIGYAIYKTAQIIAATRSYAQDLPNSEKPAYAIKSAIMILVTDGIQDPNPKDIGKRFRTMDIPDAAAYAKKEGIRLYIINIDPEIGSEKYAPNRHQMERSSQETGGRFFMVNGSTGLMEIYKTIDGLEKSHLPGNAEILPKDRLPNLYQRVSLFPWLIAIGLFCLALSIILRAFFLRSFP